MDYKEKYEMALEGIQEILGSGEDSIKMSRLQLRLQGIFPELKESENEKMRKHIIEVLKDNFSGEDTDRCIAWLEKQDEQTIVDNAEPKFKVGDWVICIKNFSTPGFDFKSGEVFRCTGINEIGLCGMTASNLDNFRLWTIQDAKDGDVLAAEDKDKIFIYNGKLDLRGRVCAYCGICKTHDGLRFTECAIGNYFTYKEPYPATKEQRDTLMKAMSDARYTFDFEKKDIYKRYDKPTEWNEEDEEMHRKCICAMRASACGFPEEEKFVEQVDNWFKSLKERYTWKPSLVQLNALSIVSKGNAPDDIEAIVSLYNDLKKLKE
jgi:hypothetical protein